MTGAFIETIVKATWIFIDQGVDVDRTPAVNLGASFKGMKIEVRKWKGRRKEGILNGSGQGDGEESDLGVITVGVPSSSFTNFIIRKGDGCILAEAGGDYNGGVVSDEAIDLPTIRSTVDPILVTFKDEVV